jgi:carbonic anhydrase
MFVPLILKQDNGGVKTLIVLLACAPLMNAQEHKSDMTPDQAIAQLMEGNHRYATGKLSHPHQDGKARAGLTKGQHPFVAILSCADSRVPPEVIFDEGLGDLFVVRVAGNITDDAVIGSLEYAVEHLGTPAILVMGHEKCGAVQAAIGGGEPKTHIQALADAITPAVADAKKQKGDLVSNSVKANVQLVVNQLSASKPILAEAVAKRKIKVVGGVYDLETGVVKLLP